MRARGAEVTDIVVLVVAADDGVMPQTVEAIDHAKAADVPIVVAVNKIDREEADPNRVLQQLSEHGLVPEAWGGDTITVEVSALQSLGIDDLLEQIVAGGRGRGAAWPAPRVAPGASSSRPSLEIGRGPVASVIVERGTLRVGDPIVAGAAWGKVKALVDDHGDQIKEAPPSTPVQVLGFSEPPEAGDEFRVAPELAQARTIGEARAHRYRVAGHVARRHLGAGRSQARGPLRADPAGRDRHAQPHPQGRRRGLARGGHREPAQARAGRRQAELRPPGCGRDHRVRRGAGPGLQRHHHRVQRPARPAGPGDGGQGRRRDPDLRDHLQAPRGPRGGHARPALPRVRGGGHRRGRGPPGLPGPADRRHRRLLRAGGVITRGSKVRFLRDGVVIWKGTITSLRRFKDDAREVQAGFECGIGLSDYQDLKEGDIIETFEEREIPRT